MVNVFRWYVSQRNNSRFCDEQLPRPHIWDLDRNKIDAPHRFDFPTIFPILHWRVGVQVGGGVATQSSPFQFSPVFDKAVAKPWLPIDTIKFKC